MVRRWPGLLASSAVQAQVPGEIPELPAACRTYKFVLR
jgi:hypothetical protein